MPPTDTSSLVHHRSSDMTLALALCTMPCHAMPYSAHSQWQGAQWGATRSHQSYYQQLKTLLDTLSACRSILINNCLWTNIHDEPTSQMQMKDSLFV